MEQCWMSENISSVLFELKAQLVDILMLVHMSIMRTAMNKKILTIPKIPEAYTGSG
jgi:hypothetical protein